MSSDPRAHRKAIGKALQELRSTALAVADPDDARAMRDLAAALASAKPATVRGAKDLSFAHHPQRAAMAFCVLVNVEAGRRGVDPYVI